MTQTGDDATIIQAVEMTGNDAVVLGSIPVTGKGTYRISFQPTGSSVQLWVLGAYDMQLKPTCYTYPVTTQETYLVDICDENKDRYRFGFNGQEKVNEIAGVGNHNTAEFWEYDTRLGRRWNVDPVVKPWESSYAAFNNSPVIFSDPNGRDGVVSGSGTELDPLVIKAEYLTYGMNAEEQKAFDEAVGQYNNSGNSWMVTVEGGSNIYVRFDIKSTHLAQNKDQALTTDDLLQKAEAINTPDADGAKTSFYESYVTPGKVDGDHFAAANNMSIIYDAPAMKKYVEKYTSGSEQGDKQNYSQLLISSFIHEIAHNLGAVHKDPGEMMNYVRKDKKPDSRSYTGSLNKISGGGDESSGEFNIKQVSRVTADGIRAIIGRIDIKNSIEQSKYLSPDEKKTLKKNGGDSYQNGKLARPKI